MIKKKGRRFKGPVTTTVRTNVKGPGTASRSTEKTTTKTTVIPQIVQPCVQDFDAVFIGIYLLTFLKVY